MSRDALSQVTLALQRLLHTALGGAGAPDEHVFIGPPIPTQVGERSVSLMMFHLEPNRELRNSERLIDGAGSDPVPQESLPLDVRYLISVHRQASAATPNELLALGDVVAGLLAAPTLGGGLLPGQEVRLTPEPYPMEELSRIWGLFPNAPYATSMIYLATPVFIDASNAIRGAPVESRRLDSGSSARTPDVFGNAAALGAIP
ncbi:MAG: DUF4255 domain-containing protein [Hyphomicrobiales bacterium]